MKKRHSRFGFSDILLRFFALFCLMLISYNPYGFSIVAWIQSDLSPFSIGCSLIVIAIWGVVLWMAYLGIGKLGGLLVMGILLVLLWMASSAGVTVFESFEGAVFTIEIFVSMLLAIGLSWAHLRRRISGQFSTDDLTETDG